MQQRQLCVVFFCERKPAYEMRISDWSSDVCSSDLREPAMTVPTATDIPTGVVVGFQLRIGRARFATVFRRRLESRRTRQGQALAESMAGVTGTVRNKRRADPGAGQRSEL